MPRHSPESTGSAPTPTGLRSLPVQRTFAALIWRARKAALEIPAGEEVRRERHLGAARRSRQKTGSGGAMACAFLGTGLREWWICQLL